MTSSLFEYNQRQMDRVPLCLVSGAVYMVDPSTVTAVVFVQGDDADVITVGEQTYVTTDKAAVKEIILRAGLHVASTYYHYERTQNA